MDITQFDTRQKAQEGVWFALVVNDQEIMGSDEEPIRFRIKGTDDPAVKENMKQSIEAGKGVPDELLAKECLAEWTLNFEVDGDPVTADPSFRDRIAEIPALRSFIALSVMNREAFMKGSSNS
jgi:hypothetical protein